jgi:hypothetical protein
MWKAFMLISVLDGSPLAAVAADSPPPPPPGHHHKIPDEAFVACKDLSEGEACTVTVHDHQHDGFCRKAHEDERLFCMPDHPPGPHPAPPQ